jgi:hypothetical protein
MVLDISRNAFGQVLIDALADLLVQNKSLKTVVFRAVGIRSPQVLVGFYRRLLVRGLPLRLSFPQEDIDDMWKAGRMSREIYQEIDDVIKRLMTGDPSVYIQQQAISVAAPTPDPPTQPQLQPAVLGPPRQPGSAVRGREPDPFEWVVNIEPIPVPDDDEVLRAFRAKNSIEVFLAKMKGESVA